MINVNLLPHHLRPIKRTPLPYLISFLVVALAIAAMGFMFVSTQAAIIAKDHELNGVKADIAKLDKVIKEAEQLEKQKKMLEGKKATINEIVANRIIWSRQLFNLARLAPSNQWYSAFRLEAKPFPETRTDIDPKTKQPKQVTVMVKRPILRVAGYVVATPGAGAEVSRFTLACEQDEEFSQLFQQTTQQVSDTEFEGSAVRNFTIEFRILTNEEVK